MQTIMPKSSVSYPRLRQDQTAYFDVSQTLPFAGIYFSTAKCRGPTPSIIVAGRIGEDRGRSYYVRMFTRSGGNGDVKGVAEHSLYFGALKPC